MKMKMKTTRMKTTKKRTTISPIPTVIELSAGSFSLN